MMPRAAVNCKKSVVDNGDVIIARVGQT